MLRLLLYGDILNLSKRHSNVKVAYRLIGTCLYTVVHFYTVGQCLAAWSPASWIPASFLYLYDTLSLYMCS